MADTPTTPNKKNTELQSTIIEAVSNSKFGDRIKQYIQDAESPIANSLSKMQSIMDGGKSNDLRSMITSESQPKDQPSATTKAKTAEKKTGKGQEESEPSDESKEEAVKKSKAAQVFDSIFSEVKKSKGFQDFKSELSQKMESVSAPFRVIKNVVSIFKKPNEEPQPKDSAKAETKSDEKDEPKTVEPSASQPPPQPKEQPSASQPPPQPKERSKEEPPDNVKNEQEASPQISPVIKTINQVQPIKEAPSEKTVTKDSEKDSEPSPQKSKTAQVFDAIFADVKKSKGFQDFKSELSQKMEAVSAPFRVVKNVVSIFKKPSEEAKPKDSTKEDANSPKKNEPKTAEPSTGQPPPQPKEQPSAKQEDAVQKPKEEPPDNAKNEQVASPQVSPVIKTINQVQPPKEAPTEKTATKDSAKESEPAPQKSKAAQAFDSIFSEVKKSKGFQDFKSELSQKMEAVSAPFRVVKNVISIFKNPKENPPAEKEPKTATPAPAAKSVADKASDTSKSEAKPAQPAPAAKEPPAKSVAESAAPAKTAEPKATVPQAAEESPAKSVSEKAATKAEAPTAKATAPAAKPAEIAPAPTTAQKSLASNAASKGAERPVIDGSKAMSEQKKEAKAIELSTEAARKHGNAEKTLHDQKMAMLAEEASQKAAAMEQERADNAERMAMAEERASKEQEHFKERGKQNKGILGFLNAEGLADKWKTALTLKNHILEMASSAKKFAVEKAHALGSIIMKGAHAAAGAVKGAFMMPFPINLVALGLGGAAVVGGILWAKKLLSGGGGGPPSAGGGGEEEQEEKNPAAGGPSPEDVASKGDKDAAKNMAKSATAMYSLILFEVIKQKRMKEMQEIMQEISEKLDKLSTGGGGNVYNYNESSPPPQDKDDENGVSTSNIFDEIRYSVNRTR